MSWVHLVVAWKTGSDDLGLEVGLVVLGMEKLGLIGALKALEGSIHLELLLSYHGKVSYFGGLFKLRV